MKIAAFIIALAGLVTWLEPKIGFFVSYLAFFLGFYAAKKHPSVLNKVSMALGGIGFGLSLIHAVLSATMV